MFKNPKDLPKENQNILNESETYKSYLESDLRSLKIETYFSVYDEILKKFQGKEITFVEIGVLHGGSLKMWRNYFGSKARIIGIDINPEAKKMKLEGFEIFIGSQSSEAFWDHFFQKVGSVDVILDDGGHQNVQQIITLYKSLPHIRDGGVIITEDVHASYLSKFGNPSNFSFINFAKKKIDKINYRFPEIKNKQNIEKKIYSITFYESIVVFNINSRKSIIPNFLANNPNSYTKNYFVDGSFSEFFPKIQNTIDKKFVFLKKIPIIKKIIRLLFYKKNFIAKIKEYFILKKYFK
tara:strand:+ start:864 stop:1748 length:885 start_codon:yes stop_codon:yes gene_type:complete